MENIQISSLGSAMLAAVKIRLYKDLEEAASHMVRVKDVFIPDWEVHQIYEKKYQEFMVKMGYRKEN